ncbi:hypothetical protein [Prauserella cavernicola]|uniref:Uncharacterized protein n=1 Tax=Prauserella cavernicola TaxID=2800127 RepID=A0A934QR26_9PSEU|nr:hypothetical protein [Prauserella cavernicola]MBK1785151.1 hypothetical protein [Prauserella cavernicola]
MIVDLDGFPAVPDPRSELLIEPSRLEIHFQLAQEQPWRAVGVMLGGLYRLMYREIEWAAEPVSAVQAPLREAPLWVHTIVEAEQPA